MCVFLTTTLRTLVCNVVKHDNQTIRVGHNFIVGLNIVQLRGLQDIERDNHLLDGFQKGAVGVGGELGDGSAHGGVRLAPRVRQIHVLTAVALLRGLLAELRDHDTLQIHVCRKESAQSAAVHGGGAVDRLADEAVVRVEVKGAALELRHGLDELSADGRLARLAVLLVADALLERPQRGLELGDASETLHLLAHEGVALVHLSLKRLLALDAALHALVLLFQLCERPLVLLVLLVATGGGTGGGVVGPAAVVEGRQAAVCVRHHELREALALAVGGLHAQVADELAVVDAEESQVAVAAHRLEHGAALFLGAHTSEEAHELEVVEALQTGVGVAEQRLGDLDALAAVLAAVVERAPLLEGHAHETRRA
eukprot:PhM_4_TR4964/c0_g1_i2/m.56966